MDWHQRAPPWLPPMLNSAKLRWECHERIPVTVIHFSAWLPHPHPPSQWFCRDGLSPCIDPPGCFDKDKKWGGGAQEVTWAFLAASEIATSISPCLGKDREWLCSAFQEAGHPLSLSCLIWEGLSPALQRSGQEQPEEEMSLSLGISSLTCHSLRSSAALWRHLCHWLEVCPVSPEIISTWSWETQQALKSSEKQMLPGLKGAVAIWLQVNCCHEATVDLL